jgi:hypothetical protein
MAVIVLLQNVHKICRDLPNVIRKYRVPLSTFNHLDFIWGKDANSLVYADVITFLKKHEHDATTEHELT